MEFRNCVFAFAHFYGARLEKCKFIDCDFVESNGFSNCDFTDTVFQDCHFNENKFVDCKFNENTRITEIIRKARNFQAELSNRDLTVVYRGIKEAYVSGGLPKQARRYQLLQNRAYTKHNLAFGFEKIRSLIWGAIAGYGLLPSRVLISLLSVFLASFAWFCYRLGDVAHALIFTSGALFTFGAKADLLDQLSIWDYALYILTSFAGISLSALFVTVMASVLLRDR